jgi:hypothetical protein
MLVIRYMPILARALAAPAAHHPLSARPRACCTRGEGEISFLETGQFAQCNYPK